MGSPRSEESGCEMLRLARRIRNQQKDPHNKDFGFRTREL